MNQFFSSVTANPKDSMFTFYATQALFFFFILFILRKQWAKAVYNECQRLEHQFLYLIKLGNEGQMLGTLFSLTRYDGLSFTFISLKLMNSQVFYLPYSFSRK